MGVQSTVVLLILVVIFAELPRSLCFIYTSTPTNPLVVYVDKNKAATFKWDWSLGNSGVLNHFNIHRYRNKDLATQVRLFQYYFNNGAERIDETQFTLVVNKNAKGSASLGIKDITNQGSNKGGSRVDVMATDANYTYKIEMGIQNGKDTDVTANAVQLVVYKTPVITKRPRSQTTSSGSTVTLECEADGKPKPKITWGKIGSSEQLSQGSPLTITGFIEKDAGVYKCTARSENIVEVATATAYVQFSTCATGSCIKKEFGIEMTDITYSFEYDNSNHKKYQDLKINIESECLAVYARKDKTLYRCSVLRFRKGSVVAVVEVGAPTSMVGPWEPLLAAIESGKFANHTVNTAFVSPTAPPTDKPEPTPNPTPSPTPNPNIPDSGARATGGADGLSTGAIVALVVVFSIVFIVIIVVLIVCMLKRKKPKDNSPKPYKDDARTYDKPVATTPLKSQPFDPMYDDPNEDRYPDGGGPPPQYTPSDYAEVVPTQQDESQVEWDKSVKDEMWI